MEEAAGKRWEYGKTVFFFNVLNSELAIPIALPVVAIQFVGSQSSD